MTEPAPARPELGQVHTVLMVALIALRPLVWDEDPLLPTCTAYAVLLLVALAVMAGECLASRRPPWQWRPSGMVLAALLAWLGLAAWRSPLPVAGWGLWASSLSQLGLAAYLLQVVPARTRLAFAALAAGVLGEAAISLLQWPWVLPGMAHAQAAGGLSGVPAQLQGALAERIANGGLYGTFTQANALAAYLLLVVPLLVVATWQARGRLLLLLAAILLLAALAFVGTASKGAVIAAGAATLGCWWWWRWRGRLLVLLGAIGVTALALQSHAIRHGLAESAHVRLGYWSGALRLVREAPALGHGLRSFGEQAPRVLPVWASFSSQVHCEVLSAAAESGLLGALLLLALMLLLVRQLPPATAAMNVRTDPDLVARWLPWALGGCILYGALLGLLDANTGWWPGAQLTAGGLPLGQMGWWLAVSAMMAVTWWGLITLPPPSPRACRLGLVALFLHSLIDFDLHAGGVVGTAVVVAVLGGVGAPASSTAQAAGLPRPSRGRWSSWLAAALVVVAAGALIAVQGTCARIRAARAIADASQVLLQSAMEPGQRQAVVAQIASDAGIIAPNGEQLPPGEDIAHLLRRAIDQAMTMAAGDRELQTRLLLQLPAGRARLAQSLRMCALRPASAVVESLCAADYQVIATSATPGVDAAQAWSESLSHLERAVELNPSDLRAHQDLAGLLDAASAALPAQAPALRRQAQEQRDLVTRERPLVDGSNRD